MVRYPTGATRLGALYRLIGHSTRATLYLSTPPGSGDGKRGLMGYTRLWYSADWIVYSAGLRRLATLSLLVGHFIYATRAELIHRDELIIGFATRMTQSAGLLELNRMGYSADRLRLDGLGYRDGLDTQMGYSIGLWYRARLGCSVLENSLICYFQLRKYFMDSIAF